MQIHPLLFRFALAATLGSALLTGCVSTPRYDVGVSGFSDPTYSAGKSYWLIPANKDAASEDLEFREFAVYLRKALSKSEYAEATNFDAADLGVFVAYGIGNTREDAYSYSMPMFGQVGGGTYNFQGTVHSAYGSSTTTGTVYQQPQFGIVGSSQVSGVSITHLRYLTLDAVDLKKYRAEKKAASVWRTDVLSRGSSGDLRAVFPVLVLAGTPYFGKDTKHRITVTVSEKDQNLQELRQAAGK